MNDIRHAETGELLALRDGEGAAWTRDHVEACAACAAELFRLEQLRARLRALPAFTPPRDRFAAIASVARRETRGRRWRGVAGLATAAALAALTFVALRPGVDGTRSAERAVVERAALERAMTRSEVLEQTLKAVAPERRALSGDALRAAAELEDRLARIDAALAEPDGWQRQPDRVVDLWQERAGVLSALVDVHTTRVAMAGL